MPSRPKRISTADIIGRSGVALVESAVLKLGFLFHETGGVEGGTDGFIELRNPQTGEISAQFLPFQVKTRQRDRYTAETDSTFEYVVTPRDLAYWLAGNTPVVLFLVRLQDQSIYWKSIQEAFSSETARQERRVHIDKRTDRLDETAGDGLTALAALARPGTYMPACRMVEPLVPNLLRVCFPQRLYLASTELTAPGDVREALISETDEPPEEWVLKGGQILSFRDLSAAPWTAVCDEGTVEDFDVLEWAEADDEDMLRDFVWLLRNALRARFSGDLWYHRERDVLFFRPGRERIERALSYRSRTEETSRLVVRTYGRRRDGRGPAYVRHSGFNSRFRRIEDEWFLAVEPTYVFTRDGWAEDFYASERLSKIKRIENNEAILGQFLMWRHYLCANDGSVDLFREEEVPLIAFSAIDELELEFGVPDELWRKREEPERMPLFEGEPPDA